MGSEFTRMMMMGMRLEPRLMMICNVCRTNGANDEEHNPECPMAQIRAAVAANPVWKCDRCDGEVTITLDDYLECRKCRRIYTTGLVTLGHNPDTLPEAYLHKLSPIEEYTKVLVFPKRGKQKRFRIDDIVRKLRSGITAWKIRNRGSE